ncbi:MAG: PD40 domain-containing protein [Bacteroidales bacterium]|nr:PD40 domain-containing protein [Bacteroidales bacterium]
MRYPFLIIISFLIIGSPFLVQESFSQMAADDSLQSIAIQQFNKQEYNPALAIFYDLLEKYPKEPLYQYYAGACLFNLNQNLEEAIRYLDFACSKNINAEAYFLLGRACHNNYQFDDAIKAYKSYTLHAKKSQVRKKDVSRWVEMAKNGKELTKFGKYITVEDKSVVAEQNLEAHFTLNASGKIIKKPKEFTTPNDYKAKYTSLMFLPSFTDVNEYIFVSGYPKNRKRGKDIFRIKNISNQEWSAPELLSHSVNSAYDEEFPYYDHKTSTLYFSSKGHNSMGGYDIFKSTYDWNSKVWSTPENLDFPINTPFDDFLFVPDANGEFALFASNRSTGSGKVEIFKIKLESAPLQIEYIKRNDILTASKLEIVETPDASKAEMHSITGKAETIAESGPLAAEDQYSLLIGEGLELQLLSDSLNQLISEKRKQLKGVEAIENRNLLFAEISNLESQKKMCQLQADGKFLQAANLKKQEKIQNAEIPALEKTNSNITLKEQIGDIKVYQYTPEAIETQSPESEPEKETGEITQAEPPAIEENSDDFNIMSQSPYNTNNPIPYNIPLPGGLIFRVQLGAFSNPIANDAFKGISPVSAEKNPENGITKYFAGIFYSGKNAAIALEQIKNYGFPDSFIVPYFNGEKISIQKAKEIEYSQIKFQ